MSFSAKKFKFLFLLAIPLALFVYVVFWNRSFPRLDAGKTFVGSLSIRQDSESASDNREINYPLRLQTTASPALIQLLIFSEGQQAEILKPVDSFLGKIAGYKPLEFTRDSKVFSLSGGKTSSGYRGEINLADKAVGVWELREWTEETEKAEPWSDLKNWMRAKAKFNDSLKELFLLKQNLENNRLRYEKLERFVKDEGMLKDRSKTKRDTIAQELNDVVEIRKKETTELREASLSLATLLRLSPRGQVVDLNRRIARREQRWFAALASSAEEPGAEEEAELAKRDGKDLQVLNAEYSRALEVQRLLNALEAEQAKIEQLKQQAKQTRAASAAAMAKPEQRRIVRIPSEENAPEPEPEEEKKESGFLWGIFD